MSTHADTDFRRLPAPDPAPPPPAVGAPAGLLVYVRGLREREGSIHPLLTRLLHEPELAGFATLIHRRTITPFVRGPLAGYGHELTVAITGAWLAHGRPPRIVLVGHSIGGLLVRYAFLDAGGGMGSPAQEWYRQVERIVLLAAPNRGFNPKSLHPPLSWAMSAALSVPILTRRYGALDAVRGAPFITNLRVQWMRQLGELGEDQPLVVQVLGTQDSAVRPSDSQDIEALANSAMVELPFATHATVIRAEPEHEDVAGEQYLLLRSAVCGTPSPPAAATPVVQAGAAKPDEVSSVVFLLHGIRADTYGWVQAVSDKLTERAPTVFVKQPSYGYLPAFNFALPFGHNRQLRQFGDWYTQMMSAYPGKPMHFVGHSNGTYIFGESLRRVPAMEFVNVYLAGSVLPSTYDWTAHGGQLARLVNACGSRDVPVGLLCSALHGLGRRDLGVAGYRGFDNAPPGRQFVTLRGGHDAGLRDERLDGVVDYILTGEPPDRPEEPMAPGDPRAAWSTLRTKAFGFASRAAPFGALAVLGGIVYGLVVAAGAGVPILLGALGGLAAIALLLKIL
jgi:pimeloyl-ACP methyl ester carboxylesterase